MPPKLNKPVGKAKEIAKAAGGGGVKKKVTAKGYKKPVPIPNGEILTDVSRQQWKIGPSIGSGGFGEIYSACKLGESSKDYNYVVKIVSLFVMPLKVNNVFEFVLCHKILGAS